MTKIQKASLLSLLVIPGIIIHHPLGYVLCFIGGYNFGSLVRLLNK
jgi:hypothetical protein